MQPGSSNAFPEHLKGVKKPPQLKILQEAARSDASNSAWIIVGSEYFIIVKTS